MVGERQHELEQRASDIRSRVAAGSLPADNATGDFDDWILHLDGFRLLMHPPTGEWLWFDRVHNSWERTGIGSGQAAFSIIDGRLAADRTGFATAPPSGPPSGPPPALGEPLAAVPRPRRRPVSAAWKLLSRLSLVIGLASTGFGIYRLLTKDDTSSPVSASVDTATTDTAPTVAAAASVHCEGDGWALDYSGSWTDTGAGGQCRTFNTSDTLFDDVAIHVGPTGETYQDRIDALADADVVEQEATTVAGLPAVHVTYGAGVGTSVIFEYIVDHDGQAFVLASTPVLGNDAEVVVPFLDAIVASLRF